jgi:hypothetical protein
VWILSDLVIGVILFRGRARQRSPQRVSSGEIWLHVLALAALFGGAFPIFAIGADPTATAPPAFVVTARGDRLSVALHHAPLGQVLSELARQAKIHVEFPASIQNDLISERFDNLPLEQGISRLLLGHSVAMVYEAPSGQPQTANTTRRLAEVWVLPKHKPVGSAMVLDSWSDSAFFEEPDPGGRLVRLDDYAHRRDSVAVNTLAQAMVDPDTRVREKAQVLFDQAMLLASSNPAQARRTRK